MKTKYIQLTELISKMHQARAENNLQVNIQEDVVHYTIGMLHAMSQQHLFTLTS